MIYIFLLILSIFLTNFSSRILASNTGIASVVFKNNIPFITLISFFIAIRYNVGTDWQGYVDHYYYLYYNDVPFNFQNFEIGYYLLANFFSNLKFSYQLFFFVVSIITWGFLTKSIEKNKLPFFIFCLFSLGLFFWSLSGIRQFISLAIFCFSLRFLHERNFIIYFLLVFISYLFHQSSLILILIYLIPFSKDYGKSFFISLFIITNIPIVFKQFDFSLSFLGYFVDFFSLVARYAKYVDQGRFFISELNEIGVGFWAFQLITFVLLWYGYSLKTKDKLYLTVYNIFAVGSIFFNIFYDFELVGRILIYPKIAMVYLFSVLLFYWSNDKKFINHYIITILLFVIYFIALIQRSASECCPYNFLI